MTAATPPAAERVAALIRDAVGIEVPAGDTDLFESGLLDSLTLVSLLTEIEQAFGFELPLEDLDLDEFRSVNRIGSYVERARGAA